MIQKIFQKSSIQVWGLGLIMAKNMDSVVEFGSTMKQRSLSWSLWGLELDSLTVGR